MAVTLHFPPGLYESCTRPVITACLCPLLFVSLCLSACPCHAAHDSLVLLILDFFFFKQVFSHPFFFFRAQFFLLSNSLFLFLFLFWQNECRSVCVSRSQKEPENLCQKSREVLGSLPSTAYFSAWIRFLLIWRIKTPHQSRRPFQSRAFSSYCGLSDVVLVLIRKQSREHRKYNFFFLRRSILKDRLKQSWRRKHFYEQNPLVLMCSLIIYLHGMCLSESRFVAFFFTERLM